MTRLGETPGEGEWALADEAGVNHGLTRHVAPPRPGYDCLDGPEGPPCGPQPSEEGCSREASDAVAETRGRSG